MNPFQFTHLDEQQQMELIWERAIYIGERQSGTLKHILYSLDGLYIEETRYLHYNMWYSYTCVQHTDALLRYTAATELSS